MSEAQARTDRMQRRQPIVAKEWQLDVLKKLQSNSRNPTEEQRSAAAAETGLDEKWVRDWFTRQRSKGVARRRKRKPAVTESRQSPAHYTTVPAFRLQLDPPLTVPSSPQSLSYRRSVSTPVDPAPHLPANPPRQWSPVSLESCSPGPSRTTVDLQTIPSSHRSTSIPLCLNNPSQNPMLVAHAATIPTYSRDPLCNRYPDFSQFFYPGVHERFSTSALLAPVHFHNHFNHHLVNRNTDSHTPMHFHDACDLFNPGGLPTHPSSSTFVRPSPVAFSMRLVDLLTYA